jgi:hypothetical protein
MQVRNNSSQNFAFIAHHENVAEETSSHYRELSDGTDSHWLRVSDTLLALHALFTEHSNVPMLLTWRGVASRIPVVVEIICSSREMDCCLRCHSSSSACMLCSLTSGSSTIINRSPPDEYRPATLRCLERLNGLSVGDCNRWKMPAAGG